MIDEAVSVILVDEQVSVPPGPAFASGVLMFCETITDPVVVHPFEEFVTVTVYVPGILTVVPAVVAPSDQAKLTPGVIEEASKLILRAVQVNVPPVPGLRSGVAMS